MSQSSLIGRLSAVSGTDVSRETLARLQAYESLLQDESKKQNLIAPSTLDHLWERHIIDSAQLVRLAPRHGTWADVGSGAGLPGLVIAIFTDSPVTLIEPRRLRVEFLNRCVERLGLSERVSIYAAKVEAVNGRFHVITARAVAALDRFLGAAAHLSRTETVWVLPKGRNAQTELAQARRNWHCDVRVEQSCTDPESEILVLTRVGAKKKR